MKTLGIMFCLVLALATGSEALEKDVFPDDNGFLTQSLSGQKILQRRAEELAAQMSGTLRVKGLFDRTFFKHDSLDKTVELLSRIYREYGKVTAVKLEYSDSPYSAHFIFETDQRVLLPVVLAVNEETGLISGMFFKTPSRKNVSLESVKEQLAALPGRSGFLAVKLNTPGVILEALHSDEAFAIASVSKLYILGAVLKEGYSWKKVLALKENAKSLPPGRMRDWPEGSPVTVHTLATAMISANDNTAADALSGMLGRQTIESLLPSLGHSDPELMKPFLKTADVFRLKSDTAAALKYMNASRPEKYWLLGKISDEPLSSAEYKPGPFAMDRIEWYATPSDLCRLMNYFRRTEDNTAREIIAINQGLDIPGNRFAYAGYKGGVEPGVLSVVWMLKKHNEDWYCLAASWNSGTEVLDERNFYELMRAAIYAIGGQE